MTPTKPALSPMFNVLSPNVAETFCIEDLSNDTGNAPYLKTTARLLADSPESVLPTVIAAVPPLIPMFGSTS